MDWPDYHKAMLAIVAYREARGEGNEGIRAVMHVIANRVRFGWGTWAHVMSAKNQFTSVSVHNDGQTIVWPEHPNPKFETCMTLAEAVIGGQDTDPTNGALYYYNPQTATSQWFLDNIANKKQKVAVLGHHEFFNGVDK